MATGGVGLGAPAALGLLVLTESGVPVPIPADVLLLLVGERAAAGAIPLWVAGAALVGIAVLGTTTLFLLARGPGRAMVDRLGPRIGITARRLDRVRVLLERRGLPALAIGRATPGLRTVTVVSAGSSRLPAGRALPALFVGAIVFHLGHLVLGYLLGPLAWEAIERARGPALVVLAVLVVVGAVFWFRRRRGRAAAQAFTEGICPACLAGDWLAERPGGAGLNHRGR